jgi:hypothetical protein
MWRNFNIRENIVKIHDKSPKIFGKISTSEKISTKFTAVHWRIHQQNSPKDSPEYTE